MGQMLRGTFAQCLRLGYWTLFRHHGFGLLLFAFDCRNEPFWVQLRTETKECDIFAGTLSLAGLHDAAMKLAC